MPNIKDQKPNNMRKIIFLGITLSCLALMGVGCIKFTSGPTGETGGVWKTVDQGETWEQKVKFPTAQGVGEIGQVNIKTIAVDPSDHLAIYAGTTADGLIYSYDGAETGIRQSSLIPARLRQLRLIREINARFTRQRAIRFIKAKIAAAPLSRFIMKQGQTSISPQLKLTGITTAWFTPAHLTATF